MARCAILFGNEVGERLSASIITAGKPLPQEKNQLHRKSSAVSHGCRETGAKGPKKIEMRH
jgi:hypothetical protein